MAKKNDLEQYQNAIETFWEVYDYCTTCEEMEDMLESYELSSEEWNFLNAHWDDLVQSATPEVDIQYQFQIGAMRTKVSVSYKRMGVKPHVETIELSGIIDADAVKALMVLGHSVRGWDYMNQVKFNKPTDAE